MTHPAMHLIARIADAANIPYDEAYKAVVDAACKHPISAEDLAHTVLCALNLGAPWPGIVDVILDMVNIGMPPACMSFNSRLFQ